MCESDRGEWGEICPDCGQRLPEDKGPLSSWKAQRPLVFPSGSSAGLGQRATSRPCRRRPRANQQFRLRRRRARPPASG